MGNMETEFGQQWIRDFSFTTIAKRLIMQGGNFYKKHIEMMMIRQENNVFQWTQYSQRTGVETRTTHTE